MKALVYSLQAKQKQQDLELAGLKKMLMGFAKAQSKAAGIIAESLTVQIGDVSLDQATAAKNPIDQIGTNRSFAETPTPENKADATP